MDNIEIIIDSEKEYLEQYLIKADDYFNNMSEEEFLNIKGTKEYETVFKIFRRLNALNSVL